MKSKVLLATGLPIAVALAGAIAIAVARPTLALAVTIPLAVLTLVSGIVIGGIAGIAIGTRDRAHRARSQAHQAGLDAATSHEQAAHRRFVARLDHELKNPVTAIRAASASLTPADAQQAELLATIDAQSARIASLVSDLRRVGDVENVSMELTAVDLAQVITDAVEDVTLAAAASGVSREISVALPKAPWPLPRVRGDADLLHLALSNVVGNAVKVSPADSVVEVRGTEHNGWVEIEVADTGLGVAAEDLETVFDELARGRTTRHLPGSGIGLSLVRVVIARHGGAVEMRSREGRGTAVVVRLPSLG